MNYNRQEGHDALFMPTVNLHGSGEVGGAGRRTSLFLLSINLTKGVCAVSGDAALLQ